jgi:uncharacterized protein YndB with AHSA1/START domain
MSGIAAVEVIVYVRAAPADVFPYFTDPDRYVRWMGSRAELEPVPGGVFRVEMPDGFAGAGTFTGVAHPRLVAFTWGFADDEARKRREAPEKRGASRPAAGAAWRGG